MKLLWIFLTTLFLIGACAQNNVELIHAAEHQFLVLNSVKLVEQQKDEDQQTIFGVISDIHLNGEPQFLEAVIEEFRKANIEYVFVLGDTPLNEQLRYAVQDTVDDTQEMIEAFTLLAQLEIPIFIMAGNHEGAQSYNTAFETVHERYPHLLNMMRYRILDLDDAAFFVVPGYHDTQFLPDDGYLYAENDLYYIPTTASVLPAPLILLSHGPPQSSGETGIDYVPNVGNVGDEQLNSVMDESNIPFSFSGHIHEAGPRIVDAQNNVLAFDTLLSEARVNVGSVADGHAVIVFVDKTQLQLRKTAIGLEKS